MAVRSSFLLGASLAAGLALGHSAPRAADTPGQQTPKDTPAKAAKLSFAADVAPVLAKYCTTCHGGKRPKGDMSLEQFKTDADALKDPKFWERVAQNLRSGDMPPSGRPKPSADEADRVLKWIDTETAAPDRTKARDPARRTGGRLNRAEYRNTVRDLLGVDFKPADDFPADDVGYGFDNIGDVLTLSPLLMEKYLSAAEQIAEQAFKNPDTRKRVLTRPVTGKDRPEAVKAVLGGLLRPAHRRPVAPDQGAPRWQCRGPAGQ